MSEKPYHFQNSKSKEFCQTTIKSLLQDELIIIKAYYSMTVNKSEYFENYYLVLDRDKKKKILSTN